MKIYRPKTKFQPLLIQFYDYFPRKAGRKLTNDLTQCANDVEQTSDRRRKSVRPSRTNFRRHFDVIKCVEISRDFDVKIQRKYDVYSTSKFYLWSRNRRIDVRFRRPLNSSRFYDVCLTSKLGEFSTSKKSTLIRCRYLTYGRETVFFGTIQILRNALGGRGHVFSYILLL